MLTQTLKHTERGLYTAAEIAEMLSVEPRTIHNWATSGIIPVAIRAGKIIRFDLDHVTQALNEETGRKQRAKQKGRQPNIPRNELSNAVFEAPRIEMETAAARAPIH